MGDPEGEWTVTLTWLGSRDDVAEVEREDDEMSITAAGDFHVPSLLHCLN